jgi:hypothetical protein
MYGAASAAESLGVPSDPTTALEEGMMAPPPQGIQFNEYV